MKNHMTFRFSTNFLNRALLVLLLIGLPTSHGNSQTTTSLTLRLSVVDIQGRVVPCATVVLNKEGNDHEITGVTMIDGKVTFVNLQPGTYKVTVKATGFATLEQSVTVSVKQSEFTLSVGPGPTTEKPVGPGPPITEKVKSLQFSLAARFERGFQYDYKLNEQPGTILVSFGSGAGAVNALLRNPEHYLQQHTLTFKFGELFPERLSMFKRGSDYLNDYLKKYPQAAFKAGNDKKYPQAADEQLIEFLCDKKPLITCLTNGGSWRQRALMGTSVNVSFSERAAVQQGVIVTSPTFGKHYQVNGGFVFDPAKLFPTATNWKSTFDEVQKIDKALALLGAGDVIPRQRPPWKQRWEAALIPKVDFKILSQFDFLKFEGALIQAPFPERALNTWTFTWDLTRMVPDTKSRVDADAITEALSALKSSLGRKEPPTCQKQCVLHLSPENRSVDVQPAFSAESCQKLAKIMKAETYQLSCVLKDKQGGDKECEVGPESRPDVLANRPQGNSCKW